MARRTRARRRQRPAADTAAGPAVEGGLAGGWYRPLADAAVVRIVDAAKEVLERTGIQVMPSPCRETFRAAGCRVDDDAHRVHIPAKLVDQALSVAANEVLLAGREEAHDLNLGGRRVYMGTGGQAVNIMDLAGRVRETRLRDNYDIGRLVGRLEHVHFYMRPVVSRDMPNHVIDVNQYYACLAATPKHVMANSYVPQSVADVRRMGEVLAGGADAFDRRPVLSTSCCWTVSPLRYATETVEILDRIIEHRIPVAISSAPQSGATSPAALAGTLVQITAEQLSGFVYINLKRPGFPAVMGCVPAQVDLRTGAFTGGSGEFALMNAAAAQIAQHLGLPLYNSSGIADSKLPDAQAGAETALTGLAAALAGANYIHHSAGFLESLLTVAYEQYVIDNDINGGVMRVVRGSEVTEETLSLDVIDQVCRGEGHFLGHAQTLGLMNSEYVYPEVMDRASREDWEAEGAKDMRQAAREKAREVLDSHFPQVIPPDLDGELRRLFDIRLSLDEMRRAAA